MYLGMTITESKIRPQKLKIEANIVNLYDVQRLVGDLQWLCNICGITNCDLQPLFELLQGGHGPQDP
ncbi:POK8 protein, partial [Notiomystis cincta]|nr:POK8 protein [Notiomystis cincta]